MIEYGSLFVSFLKKFLYHFFFPVDDAHHEVNFEFIYRQYRAGTGTYIIYSRIIKNLNCSGLGRYRYRIYSTYLYCDQEKLLQEKPKLVNS